jgi:Transposase DDE domain group 1
VKRNVAQKVARRKRRILKRLQCARNNRFVRGADPSPVIGSNSIRYELSERSQAICHGGVGLMMKLARSTGLVSEIDQRLHLLKVHAPYQESDHVLAHVLNMYCGGTRLDHLELLRNDEAVLNAVGADSLPDPTTAGDFCRRFTADDLDSLTSAIHRARRNVWRQQPREFFDEAVIDVDGVIVGTGGECKEGMDISFKGIWGYHPLLVSFAKTKEVLAIVNRPGNVHSADDAARHLDTAIQVCDVAGFRKIRLRGDCKFSQTEHLDGWNKRRVIFNFGYEARANLIERAETLPESAWRRLKRSRRTVKTVERAKPVNVKRQIIRRRGFVHLELEHEDVAEFEYKPTACHHGYRMVVVRKNITKEQGETALFDEIRYFFYISNDESKVTAEQIVFSCNKRCDQENLISQLKSGVRSLCAPSDNLLSNAAYMLMTSLAWTMKAWSALMLPIAPRHRQKHEGERNRLLTMEFRTFLDQMIHVPCQIIRHARETVFRVLNWTDLTPAFFRLSDCLRL